MVCDSTYAGQEKEKLYIIAAMFNFTNQKDSALFYLEKASGYSYLNKKIPEENSNNLDMYLADLIIQYKEILNKGDRIME